MLDWTQISCAADFYHNFTCNWNLREMPFLGVTKKGKMKSAVPRPRRIFHLSAET